ncbi:PhzF family phenazine biosynthesis protein [Sphingosinicella microcystinivorans]|uniref:PhzF family phenazine biosynthesis protein n=1 Tax=Sphingosinicella microcystinivorans TaxID=335406 RepID=UPI0022F3A349|nr:PhzF family phenazine biosynthesis protein [Sphingosinicella microcystinivorans]WBX83724.1 PhzF family phenazine biosynthesis protein [Sphingosinicella microcystinivorans]
MPDKLPFAQIDAFAARAFEGNPAAVMPLEAWLADDVLQAIAEENNLAETAFFIPSDAPDADYDLRWFTPAIEVDLCGHATLASGHYLLSRDVDLDSIRFRTRLAGVLEVRRAGSGYELDLPARRPLPAEADPRVVKAIGLRPEAVLSFPGENWLYVVADASAVRAMKPDFGLLREIGNHLVVVTAPGDGAFDVVSRVFAAGAGIDEDPVTGAAHAMLTPYWAERLGKPVFQAFQASPRGGRIACRLEGDRAVLGGTCVTVIEGSFTL